MHLACMLFSSMYVTEHSVTVHGCELLRDSVTLLTEQLKGLEHNLIG